VLPHPGGGGETYVDALARMEGYRFERVHLTRATDVGRAGASLRVARRASTVAWIAHRYDLLHVHGEIAGAVCLPTLAARRSVWTTHGLHVVRRAHGAARLAAIANLRLLTRASNRTICVSKAECEELRALVGESAARRLRVITNGVAPAAPVSFEERAAARASLGLDDTTVVGVYVGGLDPHKDPLIAARAVRELADGGAPVALLVAGEGPLKPELEDLSRGAGGNVIRVLGHRPDARSTLVAGDFFVLPSLREGLSFALLEAMSLGLAPVVSDAPGNPEAVGDAGAVVPRGDLAGLVAAVRRLVNADERRLLGQRARERVLREFPREEMVEQTRAVYDEILGSRRD